MTRTPTNSVDSSGLMLASLDGGSTQTLGDAGSVASVLCDPRLGQGTSTAGDTAAGAAKGISVRASVLGRLLRGGADFETRSYAGRLLRGAGDLSSSPAVRGVARSAPWIGTGVGVASDLATGNSIRRTSAHAIGGLAGGAAGTAAGSAVCGVETVATAGVGSLACPFIIAGAGAIGAWAGNKASSVVSDWFGW